MNGVEWRGAGVTRECTWSGTMPRMNLIVTALNANFNSVSSVTWLLRSERRSSIPEDMPNISYTLTANHDVKQFLSIVTI